MILFKNILYHLLTSLVIMLLVESLNAHLIHFYNTIKDTNYNSNDINNSLL